MHCKFILQIALQNDIRDTTVRRSIHEQKLNPFKFSFVQELTEDHPDLSTDLSEVMMNKLNKYEVVLGTILFLNNQSGEVNGQICKY